MMRALTLAALLTIAPFTARAVEFLSWGDPPPAVNTQPRWSPPVYWGAVSECEAIRRGVADAKTPQEAELLRRGYGACVSLSQTH
jgi:hypothetical protein